MKKFLGQHFLKNSAVIKKIIAALDVQPGDTIIEIGSGHGELTIPLAEVCGSIGAKIIAVEKDAKLAAVLEAEVVHADILEYLKTVELPAGGFKIAGNIPYYLTGHLLRVVSELATKPVLAVLMIQKEVAERIVAAPPRMNRLAASVQFWAEPKIIAQVPRGDFSPPPKVDSAVIRLDGKLPQATRQDAERYYAAVRAIFAQPRKTILNNLGATGSPINGEANRISKEEIAAILTKIGINPKARPQNLTIENILQIAEVLF